MSFLRCKMRILVLVILSLSAISPPASSKRGSTRGKATRVLDKYIPFSSIGLTVDKRVDVIGLSVLAEDFDEEADVKVENIQTTESRYKFIESNQDANDLLGISGKVNLKMELGVNAEASGAGSYLNSVGNRKEFAELLFVTHVTTNAKSLKNIGKSIDGKRCKKIPNRLKGTHIITGIEYGAHCIISVRIATVSDDKKNDIKGKIKGAIGVSSVDITASGELSKVKNELSKMSNVSVMTFCNARLNSFPTNGEEAVELAKSFPALVHEQIPEGIPVRMELTPIADIPSCGFSPKWSTGSILAQYIDDTVTMVQDLKSAYAKLWSCMDILATATDKRSMGIKTAARDLRDRMKKTDYALKAYIEGIDQNGGTLQFEKVNEIYTEGNGMDNTAAYGNQYWNTHTKKMCTLLNTLEIETEETELLRHENCDKKPNVVKLGKKMQWSVGGDDPEKAVDGITSSCFKAKGSAKQPAVWTTRMLTYARRIQSIDITFNDCDMKTMDDIDVYVTSDPENMETNVRPKDMFHVGMAQASVLRKNIGLVFQPRGLRLVLNDSKGYVSVLRLESNGTLCLCEVAVAGTHCPSV